MMANLTWSNTQEWGMDGVDLASLPPKIYAALYRLHELEHDKDKAREHLAKMYGVDPWWLQDVLQRRTGPWHSVEEIPKLCGNLELSAVTSERLLLHSTAGDVWPGYCEVQGEGLVWKFLGGLSGPVDQWMEMPVPPAVSNLNTEEGGEEDGSEL